MVLRDWYRPVSLAFLIGGGLIATSCGGGGPSFVIPVCALTFVTPNYAAVVDPAPGGSLNKLRWWRGFPVKVWIDPGTAVVFNPGNILSTDMILAGINRWPVATSNGVRITIVASRSDADIEITMLQVAPPPSFLGDTVSTVNVSTREVVRAVITIAWWNTMTVQEFRDGMKATAAHEMGHALYIGGHSADVGDLLYWQNNSSLDKAISGMDMNTIQTAYCGNFQTRGRGVGDGLPGEGPFVVEKTVCPAQHS